jgi:hypothetical protein
MSDVLLAPLLGVAEPAATARRSFHHAERCSFASAWLMQNLNAEEIAGSARAKPDCRTRRVHDSRRCLKAVGLME